MLTLYLPLVLILGAITATRAVTGWTYASTPSNCQGTASSPCGPPYWYKIPKCNACNPNNATSSQSPIDIGATTVDYSLTNIFPLTNTFDGCTKWTQFANNYTFEISFQESNCKNLTMSYQGVVWTLAQIHFHSPSEHTIAGGYYSAEAHLVHTATVNGVTKNVALAVFLQESAVNFMPSNNSFLQNLWSQANPSSIKDIVQAGEVDAESPINPYNTFLPARRSYYTYPGSFTSPPCTQSVTWVIFDEPVMVSPDDIRILRSAFSFYKTALLSANGNNNRYPQLPINLRTVRYYVGFDQPQPSNQDDYVKSNAVFDDDAVVRNTNVSAIALSFASILVVTVGYLFYKVNELQKLLAWESNKNRQAVELQSANPMNKT